MDRERFPRVVAMFTQLLALSHAIPTSENVLVGHLFVWSDEPRPARASFDCGTEAADLPPIA